MIDDPGSQDPQFKRYVEQVGTIDELTHLTLTGHLLLEESLSEIVQRFLFHPDRLEGCQLRYPQLVELARALSLDESKNTMWDLIAAINPLRNSIAHSLNQSRRKTSLDNVRTHYYAQAKWPEKYPPDDKTMLMFALAISLGFLGEFKREADRFRAVVDEMDRTHDR